MKICTITCHDVYNAGASLQAYALMKYLSNIDFVDSAEIIDYKPFYLSRHYYLWGMNPKFDLNFLTRFIYYCIKVPGRVLRLFSKRKKAYDSFKKNFLNVTKKRYTSNTELKNDLPEADVFIAGSDQIWNPILENGRDPSFYLDFVPNDKLKMSYAASYSVESIPEDLKSDVKNYLSRFHAISLRELSGVEIVKELGFNNAINVLDPVFLLSKEEWEANLTSKIKSKYILIYDFDNNEVIKESALYLKKKYGYEIYSVLKSDYADRTFENEGPLGFVSLVSNATVILSNSFHATAFSIIFKKNFYVFNRNMKINTRMRDLLLLCDLEDRLKSDLIDNIDEINWDKTSKLNLLIDKSKRYIYESLGAKYD